VPFYKRQADLGVAFLVRQTGHHCLRETRNLTTLTVNENRIETALPRTVRSIVAWPRVSLRGNPDRKPY